MKPTGNYPLSPGPEEMQRLRMQAQAMEPDADVLLAHIGVQPGWRCLDLACGVGGITNLLSRRVGPTGRVIGLDSDAEPLTAAREWAASDRLFNVEFVEGDAYRTGLPAEFFDLVHVRFLFSAVGHDEELLAEMLRVTRPGGVVAVQEVDLATLRCYPALAAWDRLTSVLAALLARTGGDGAAGPRMFGMLRRAELGDVRLRPFLVAFRSDDAMVSYLPRTINSLRDKIVALGLMSDAEIDGAITACERHLVDPDTVSTSYLVFQVWGQKNG